MKKLLVIDPEVLAKLSRLPKDEKNQCWLALYELTQVFGQPHVHSGIGIRKIGKHGFECRGNVDLRFAFHNRESDLYVSFLGNHDELRRLIRSGKFN